MKELVLITKALADENRLRALAAVLERELCVCQITELLALAPSTVSKHLSILKQAGLVETRKDGRWIFYKLADVGSSPQVAGAVRWVAHAVEGDPAWKDDRKRLKAILNVDPEELCRRQCERKQCNTCS